MATTPKFVRLPTRLNRTCIADVDGGSGWGISGLDVKEFPDPAEEPRAWTFVTEALRAGRLEESDQAQYDAVQHANQKVALAGAYDEDAGESINESAVQFAARKAFRDLANGVPAPVVEEEVDEEVTESDDDGEVDDFEAMTRDQLVEYAKEVHGVTLPTNVSKAKAYAAVVEAEAAAS